MVKALEDDFGVHPGQRRNHTKGTCATFKFIGKDDEVTLVKWRFEPEDGEKSLSDDQLKTMPTNFLEAAMIERVKQGPVKWDMIVTLGEPGDPETDPSKL
jgi:catalase